MSCKDAIIISTLFSSQKRQATATENASIGSIVTGNEPTQPPDVIDTQQSQSMQPSDITSQGLVLNVSISRSSNVSVSNLGNLIYYTRETQSPHANMASSLVKADGNLKQV